MALSYVKGLRTRYFNLLGKEIRTSTQLLQSDISTEEVDVTLRKVTATKVKLKQYKGKYEIACGKLASAVEEIENEEQRNKMAAEEERYADFLCDVIDHECELTAFEQYLKDQKAEFTQKSASKLDELLATQTKLMQQLVIQGEQKQKEHSTPHTSNTVKLPKLEIPCFTGDVLNFHEFWDSFEVCVHSNTRLADVEKFTYLKSKLKGDALQSVAGLSLNNANYTVAINI